jgi:tRNA 2-thiouridine synthesizing protein A
MRPTSVCMIHDLDATGLLCPLPVLKARKRLNALTVGDQLRMRADDPAAVIDVPHFCAQAGHTLVESTQDGDVQIYLIEKTS